MILASLLQSNWKLCVVIRKIRLLLFSWLHSNVFYFNLYTSPVSTFICVKQFRLERPRRYSQCRKKSSFRLLLLLFLYICSECTKICNRTDVTTSFFSSSPHHTTNNNIMSIIFRCMLKTCTYFVCWYFGLGSDDV